MMGQKQQLLWDLPPRDTFEMNRALYEIPPREFAETVEELTRLLELAPVVETTKSDYYEFLTTRL